MYFQTSIAVLDTTGKLASASVPATPSSCWLCAGTGLVRSSGGDDHRITCSVCDGVGLVFDVAWDQVTPDVREAYEALWECESRA